jgi:hypothetical protein
MCREVAYLSQQYTLPQLDQGVKFALSAAGVWFRVYLLDERLPIDSRVACIRSMEIVFSEFLARSTAPVMEHCFYMWWDYLSFEKENRTDDLRQIRQAMFETLVRILAIDDPRCQQAALPRPGAPGPCRRSPRSPGVAGLSPRRTRARRCCVGRAVPRRARHVGDGRSTPRCSRRSPVRS